MHRIFLCRIHITIPQDRASAERIRHVVLFLAKSDPVGLVDVGDESSSAPETELAGPEFADDLVAAPPWLGKTIRVRRVDCTYQNSGRYQ
jgi:hypothetical protein